MIFRLFGRLFAGTIYRVRTFGVENLPRSGFLLVPNHMTYVDAIILQFACPRPVRFIVHESIYQIPWLQLILKLMEAIPISNVRARKPCTPQRRELSKGKLSVSFRKANRAALARS